MRCGRNHESLRRRVFSFAIWTSRALFLAGGSTGLASGNIMDAAVVAAFDGNCRAGCRGNHRLLAARVVFAVVRLPIKWCSRCWMITLPAAFVRSFQDLNQEFNRLVYQCFVTGRDGRQRATWRKSGAYVPGC